METEGWNHNVHYHDLILRAAGPVRQRALDVGCGQGLLARKLAGVCREVVGIDRDHATIERARATGDPRISFIEGDVMTSPLIANGTYDLITVVAALHHLPLAPALARLRDLLRPAGTLVVIGLYRANTPADFAQASVALPASLLMRCFRPSGKVEAPIQDPRETLSEISTACRAILPAAELKRRLFFRYSLIWHRHSDSAF